MSEAEREVLVVGAGPAGSATAFALASAGVAVTLIDRAHFPRAKPCAEYLSPQASRILGSMGVLSIIEASGAAKLAGMRIRAPGGITFEGRFIAAHGYRGFRDCGLSLPRVDLDALLLGAARGAGAEVREGWRLRDLVRDGNGRVVGAVGSDADGHPATLRARVVVAADGLRSMVARRLGLQRRARLPERYALVAHYTGVDGIGDHGEMHVERDGYVGLADIGGGRTTVALVVPKAGIATAHRGAAEFLTRWLGGHAHLAERFRDASLVGTVQTTGPFASSARDVWAPGAALVGDAAEFFDPFTGEGIYTALRGGELLAPYVRQAVRAASAEDADRALAAYATAQRREFRGKRIVERLVALAVAHPWLLDRAARALAARGEMADLLIGVTGDFVPAREVLRARFLFDLLRPAPR